MSAINTDNRDGWQKISDMLDATRPRPGRRVRIVGGRKHKGREGTVIRHQISKYTEAYRYASEAQAHMRDMRGREGWICLVRDDNSKEFWVDAAHTEVGTRVLLTDDGLTEWRASKEQS